MDGALPGIVMPGAPEPGETFRVGYVPGEMEERAWIAATGETLTGTTGMFDEVAVVENWSDLEPDVVERKYYAPGTGLVRQDSDTVDADVIELVAHEPGT